ncbi:MAG: M24 family metallopeptidase [Bacilli bacterium]|nr:M24 family metallopeptidase [Bacilli bacterium]
MDINSIQALLREKGVDAWIMIDYENKNPTVAKLLGNKMLTRKIILVIPASSKPYVIAHFIDTVFLNEDTLTSVFDIKGYKTWQEMLTLEREEFQGYKKVMMDISEYGLLPRVSLADYGSVDFVRGLGIEILSSADIQQFFSAKLSKHAYETQIDACKKALRIKDEAFRRIKDDILEKGISDEYEIQQFIARRFTEEGMVYDEAPIVAIGPNASNPHYGPSEDVHSPIREGDLVLIDMWAKNIDPEGVYADITWMGYVGKEVPKVYEDRFNIVKAARDGVIEFLTRELPKRRVEAYEADDVARKIITDAGYGPYFKHRVGHNIADDVSPHGAGANLDNYETHDTRELLDGTSFSDEPGIYAEDFGVRSETDLHNDGGKLVVVGGLQDKIIEIMNLD